MAFYFLNKNLNKYFPESMNAEKKQFKLLFFASIICYPILTVYYLSNKSWMKLVCCVEVELFIQDIMETVWDLIPLASVLWLHAISYKDIVRKESLESKERSALLESRRKFEAGDSIESNPNNISVIYEDSDSVNSNILESAESDSCNSVP